MILITLLTKSPDPPSTTSLAKANRVCLGSAAPCRKGLLGGSGDLVSKVISTLIGVISSDKYSYLIYDPSY